MLRDLQFTYQDVKRKSHALQFTYQDVGYKKSLDKNTFS